MDRTGRRAFVRAGIGLATWMVALPAATVGRAQSLPGAGRPPTDVHLRFAVPYFQPFYDRDAEGRPTGALLDLIDLISREAGLTWSAAVDSAPRMTQVLLTGNADATILVLNPTLRDRGFLRSAAPVSEFVLNVYRRSDTPAVATPEDLHGRSVAVMRGFTYGGLIERLTNESPRIAFNGVNREELAVRLVESGRATYALLYDVNYATALRQMGRAAHDIRFETLQRLPAYLYLNPATLSDAPGVMEVMTAAHRRLVAAGELPATPDDGAPQFPD